MRRKHSFALALLILLSSVDCAPVWSGPPTTTTVTVIPNAGFRRPYYYYPPYYRPYGFYPDPVPIVPPAPTMFQYGGIPAPGVGVTITAPFSGFPQIIPPVGNPNPFAMPAPGALAAAGAGVDQALQLLTSPRERDRIDAAIVLGRNRIEKAVDPLQQILANDSSAHAREAAARGLGLIGSPASLKSLQTAAQSDDDRDVRHSAQFAAESIRLSLK